MEDPMGSGTDFFITQTTGIIRQLIVIGTLLLGFSFSSVVQLATNPALSPRFVQARRIFFWALLMFIAATGALLLMLVRIHSYLAVHAVTEPEQAIVPTYALGWFNLFLAFALGGLSVGLVLWISGICLMATSDGKRFAPPIVIASMAILLILTLGLLLPDT
jgi:hypothetical protein